MKLIFVIFPDKSKLYESFDSSIHSNDLIFGLAYKTKIQDKFAHFNKKIESPTLKLRARVVFERVSSK